MTGPIGLHGGAEFTAGDEPFLLALLEAAAPSARKKHAPICIVIVPTAAARGRPGGTAAQGRQAFERVASATEIPVRIDVALIVDRSSADDRSVAAPLADADLIYLPGGDPDLVPTLLRDSFAWSSILEANARGAVLAGASAGAMALAPRTWTPRGWVEGLGLVHGLIVVPHFNGFDKRGWESTVETLHGAGLGYLGLDERTGLVSSGPIDGFDRVSWRVVGPGQVTWAPPGGEPVSATSGAMVPLPS